MDPTTAPPRQKRNEIRLYHDEVALWQPKLCVFTLNLGRLCWSSSASRISSVISTLLLKRFGLAWLGLDEFCPPVLWSSLAGRDFLSLPNTTPSQSFNHLSKHRLVNYRKTDGGRISDGIILQLERKRERKTHIVTEELSVVPGRKSVHPQPRDLRFCVWRILILLLFWTFRLHKLIIRAAKNGTQIKTNIKYDVYNQVFNIRGNGLSHHVSSSVRCWDSSSSRWWRWEAKEADFKWNRKTWDTWT